MDIVVRSTVMFAAIFLLLRLLGKREIAEMTPFDMVLLIVMGDLIQQGVTHNDFSLTGAVLAISTFAFWSLVLNWLSFRFRWAEKLLDGKPSVIIRDGTVLKENLARTRITRSEIESEMRLAGISRMSDVAWAILEPDGKISFIRHPQDRSTPSPSVDPERGPIR